MKIIQHDVFVMRNTIKTNATDIKRTKIINLLPVDSSLARE